MKKTATVILGSCLALASTATLAATCPKVTGADKGGKYPHLYEKAEFEAANSCTMAFSQNPKIADLNSKIRGNDAKLPPVAERIPAEPLVVVPYDTIGTYGGILNGVSKATEAGSSEVLSFRHVNLVRFSDDLKTLVPNVAKGWEWNKDFTKVVIKLRKGHKWSDGKPFTAHDVAFWYNDLLSNKKVMKKVNNRFLSDGKPWKVTANDDQTVTIELSAPKPSLMAMFATDYAQPFQPKHVLSKFHPDHNKEADALAKKLGYKDAWELLTVYYGQTDWKDHPTPILKTKDKIKDLIAAGLPATAPTLEAFIVVEDTVDGRKLVANPYFFQVDTAGNQLPYIDMIDEDYIGDQDIQTTKLIAGEIDFKSQSVNLPSTPVLLENAKKGNYQVALRPNIGLMSFAFNVNDKNPELRELFNKKSFRKAMSIALDRKKINEIGFLKLGKPMQYTAIDPDTAPFIPKDQVEAYISYNADQAKSLLKATGLKDSDGDGVLELPSGKKLELVIQFSTQGVAPEVVEIVAKNWSDVGVKTTMKEVTSDEYRNAQSANDLSVLSWTTGQPLAVVANDTTIFRPPFGGFFSLRNGMLWSQYIDTKGKEGVKPPESVMKLQKLSDEFVKHAIGSEQSNKIGNEIVKTLVDDLYIIGTVKGVSPIYASKNIGNVKIPLTSSYEYYRTYPYLPTQWYMKNGK